MLELFGPPGALEEVALEATQTIASPWKPHKFVASVEVARGFVRVRQASWDLACELAARLSTVHDVRLAFPEARIHGWDDVDEALERMPWSLVLPHAEPVSLHTEAGQGVTPHAGRLRTIAEEFFTAQGHRSANNDLEPSTRIDLSTYGTTLRTRVSLGGDALHKRGWRAGTGSLATLREDLACAALVRLAELEPRAREAARVIVPFAGSGTLGMEAWHALYGLPPNVWGAPRAWQRLNQPKPVTLEWWRNRTVRAAREAVLPPIVFVENNKKQALELESNAQHVRGVLEHAGVGVPEITVLEADVFDLTPEPLIQPQAVTLMPLHPPYGLRLSRSSDTHALYARLGQCVCEWGLEATHTNGALIGFCLCPTEHLWRAFLSNLGDARAHTSHITQGGLDVRLCMFAFEP